MESVWAHMHKIRLPDGPAIPLPSSLSTVGAVATWHKLVGERQVQQARARRAAAAGHPHIGRLDVQVAQPARVHLRQRLRAGSRAQALAYP